MAPPLAKTAAVTPIPNCLSGKPGHPSDLGRRMACDQERERARDLVVESHCCQYRQKTGSTRLDAGAKLARRAGVAELGDAAGLGPAGRKPLEVRVLSPALRRTTTQATLAALGAGSSTGSSSGGAFPFITSAVKIALAIESPVVSHITLAIPNTNES